MRRFSILTLMGCVLACGIGFAALRDANPIWASVMGLATLALLGVAVLGIVHRRGRKRAWWLGFALFGGLYHLLAAGPWVADVTRPTLPTTQLLDYTHSLVVGPGAVVWTTNALPAGSATTLGLQSTGGTNLTLTPQTHILSVVTAPPGGAQTSFLMSGSNLRMLLPGAVNYEPFLRVGHCLFAIMIGLLGAFVSGVDVVEAGAGRAGLNRRNSGLRNETGRDRSRPARSIADSAAQAGCHWLSTSLWSLFRWMWSWTLATQDIGIRWCIPSGLSFLVSLIWSPSTWSTLPTFVPHEA